jgi:hypothetical protein
MEPQRRRIIVLDPPLLFPADARKVLQYRWRSAWALQRLTPRHTTHTYTTRIGVHGVYVQLPARSPLRGPEHLQDTRHTSAEHTHFHIHTGTARARTWPVLEGSFVTRQGLLRADVLSEAQEVNRRYCLRHGYRFVTEVSISLPPSLYLSLSLSTPPPQPPLSLSMSVFSSVSFLSHARGSRQAQAHTER